MALAWVSPCGMSTDPVTTGVSTNTKAEIEPRLGISLVLLFDPILSLQHITTLQSQHSISICGSDDGDADMGDSLNPFKNTKRVQSNTEKFETLSLKEQENRAKGKTESQRPIIEINNGDKSQPALIESSSTHVDKSGLTLMKDGKVSVESPRTRHDAHIFLQKAYLHSKPPSDLPNKALEIIKGQAGIEDILSVFEYLDDGIQGRHDFNVKITGPKAALIVKALVTTTIPDLWTNLKEMELSDQELRLRDALLNILRSVTGLEALCTQLQSLARPKEGFSELSLLHDYIDVLSRMFSSSKLVTDFLGDSKTLYEKDIPRRLFWQGITSLLAGSKILAAVSQAQISLIDSSSSDERSLWLGDGSKYSQWLGRNIVTASMKLPVSESQSWSYLGQLLKRGLSLGHREDLVAEVYTGFLLGPKALWTPLQCLLKEMPPYDQKIVFDSILHDLSRKYFGSTGNNILNLADPTTAKAVSGVAALIQGLVDGNEILEEHLIEWASLSGGKYAAVGLGMRRALIVLLSQSQDKLQRVLEKSLTDFGDKLQIQHSSITQQENLAQTSLLLIGELSRLNLPSLKHSAISSLTMHAVSNRLASSVPRARFLGMVLGVGMSKCVDQPEKVMNFDVEDMETAEAKSWLDLVEVKDHIGEISDLHEVLTPVLYQAPPFAKKRPQAKAVKRQSLQPTSKIIAIEEVPLSSDDEDDLIPYQKPDDDPEDSDEDPTLINRAKPTPPIYIIDLIKQLRISDKPDVVSLALKTAPALIRRKANFGTELSDNIHALASALINLQEGISDHEQVQLRLESLIACFIAKPSTMSQYFTHQYFNGDYSLSQHNMILTVLGLGSRELAGFKDHGNIDLKPDFPSKRLPAHLRSLLASPDAPKQNPIASLTSQAAHDLIRPMALSAADSQSGPSALKIRTFSSRMDVEKRRLEQQKERTKRIPKNIHAILTNDVYIPLCSPMALFLSSTRARHSHSSLLHPSTMRLFLQTLTLVLTTLGPLASIHLSTLTRETLLLLIALHSLPLAIDPVVLPALLHLLLALIDITVEIGVTAQEHLIVDHGTQVAELVNWANGLSDQMSIPTASGTSVEGDDGMPWTVLAAGIAVKWMEIGKKFQGRMLGLSIDDDDL